MTERKTTEHTLEHITRKDIGRKDRILTIISLSVCIVLLCYALSQIFFSNALLSTWTEKDGDRTVSFGRNEIAMVTTKTALDEEKTVEIPYTFVQDQDNWTVTISLKQDAIAELADTYGLETSDSTFQAELVKLQKFCGTYDYTIRGEELKMVNHEMSTTYTFSK